jgi:transcriptional regulator with XRE-family HTH domain
MGKSGDTMPTLQESRQERGWSPEDLSSRSGIPTDVIAALEAGQRQQVTSDVIWAIASALEVDASTVYELRPSLGLSTIGESGSGEP